MSKLSRDVLLDVLMRASNIIERGPNDARDPVGALARACDELGVDVDGFDAAVSSDIELELLRTNLLRAATAGTAAPARETSRSRTSGSVKTDDSARRRSEPERTRRPDE